jgi:hypothetical protein
MGDSSPHVPTKLDDDLLNRFSFNRTMRGKSVDVEPVLTRSRKTLSRAITMIHKADA